MQAIAARLEAAAEAEATTELTAAAAPLGVAEASMLEAARDTEEVAAATGADEVAVYLPGHPTPGRATSWA